MAIPPGNSAEEAGNAPPKAVDATLHKCLEECYGLALRSAADYAVDFDPAATTDFRRHVHALEARVPAVQTIETLRSLQASFRGELREYRDLARAHLKRVHDDLEGAIQVMQTFSASFISGGEDVQQRVRVEMVKLEKAAESGDIDRIRTSVRTVVDEVNRSFEELNRVNAMITAELQHEIRLLHHEIEADRRLAWTDPVSGAWIRRKIDNRIAELTKSPDPFSIVVVLVSNLKRLRVQCTGTIVDRALKALVQRFYGILGEDRLIARIAEDQFAAILEIDTPEAQQLISHVRDHLSTRYSVQNDGIAQSVDLRVRCALVGRPKGAASEEFLRRLEQMTGSLNADPAMLE